MKKLAIIPAYNEAESIICTVKDIQKNAPDFDYIVINDCSKDNTYELCIAEGFHILNLPLNLGIGGAVQTGYRYALENGYDIAVQFDGDGQHDARYLGAMADMLTEKKANMIIGSRFIEKEGYQSSGLRRIGITFFSFLIKALTGKRITDPTSGFRMCDRKIIEMFADGYPKDYPEPETTMKILRNHLKVEEMPVKMRAREGGKSSISMKKSVYYMIKVSIAIVIERMR